MVYLKHFSLALGLVAAAGMAAPALAHNHEAGLELAHNHEAEVAEVEAAPEAPIEIVAETVAPDAAVIDAADLSSDASLLLPAADAADLFDTADFGTSSIESALLAATVELAPEPTETLDLAQSTRAAYEITPAYLGVGGNIGIGNRGDSALSSFGFNIISKISLGPRFSVRAGATATNDRWGFTIPVTYNFNTVSAGGFRAQPYVGAGVEIPTSGDVGLLVNAGADVPISRDFTLNGAANFRLTSGFALGISLGVGYNFPFIFE